MTKEDCENCENMYDAEIVQLCKEHSLDNIENVKDCNSKKEKE